MNNYFVGNWHDEGMENGQVVTIRHSSLNVDIHFFVVTKTYRVKGDIDVESPSFSISNEVKIAFPQVWPKFTSFVPVNRYKQHPGKGALNSQIAYLSSL